VVASGESEVKQTCGNSRERRCRLQSDSQPTAPALIRQGGST